MIWWNPGKSAMQLRSADFFHFEKPDLSVPAPQFFSVFQNGIFLLHPGIGAK